MTNGSTNFGDLPKEFSTFENAKVVLLPVPFDGTSTWLKGADGGPAAIIQASANMELYDIETDSQVYRQGIFTDSPVDVDQSPEKMVEAVAERVKGHLEREKFVVTVGGEHSVSIGAMEACVEKFGNITILQLDAHTDLRDEYEGSKFNHACVMARAKEIASIVQVGIRSMDYSEKESVSAESIFFAEAIYNNMDWFEKALGKLSGRVYITIDLDVFDPSIMPSTGTPEPGGLLWYDTLAFLKLVFEKREVLGFDIVELCPGRHNKAPDFLAAKLIYKLLSYKFRE